MEYWSDDMSSEYDDAIYDRQRREVDQEGEYVSSKSNRVEPLGYNIMHWIKGAVSKLTGINPTEQVKKDVGFNVDDTKERAMLNDVDAVNNEWYQGKDLEYLCALNNNVIDSSKLLGTGYKVEQLLNGFTGNGSTTIIKGVNYDLLGKQGNLLLLDLLMRKKGGIKYKCQQEQNIVSSNNVDSEYAQSMAYRGYIAKDKFSSVSNNNMPCMVGEDIGLVGVN